MGRKKLDDVQLSGAARKTALAAFRKQIIRWGLKMPKVSPILLDFGLAEFDKTGLIEYWVANDPKTGYCGKFLFVFDGQTCPTHRHGMKHETFFVMKGAVRMTVNGKSRLMREGDRLVMPPGAKHSFRGEGPALLIEVSQPSVRGDNFFQDKRIGDNGVI